MSRSIPPRRPPPNYKPTPEDLAAAERAMNEIIGDSNMAETISNTPRARLFLNVGIACGMAALVGFGGGVALTYDQKAAAPATVAAPAPKAEKPRAADAENIGAEIQRVDDWERGVSCYKVRGSDSIALQCLAMPADAPARATRLENVML